MDFLRAALHFQSQYRGDLTPKQRNEIEVTLFELEPLFERLCTLQVSARAELEKIKCEFFQRFVDWKGQSDLFSTLLLELSKKIGTEGFNALIGAMLSDVFGDNVGARVTAIYGMVKDLYDMTKALLDHELAEVAILDNNQPLCGMIERAARLRTVSGQYAFVLPEGTTGNFQVWHPSSEQDNIISTTVTPIMKCWFPKEDGEPGDGTWEPIYFKWLGSKFVPSTAEGTGSFSRTFDKDHAVKEGGDHVHHFQIDLPRIKPGIKCDLILQTKRVFKSGLAETVQHLVGVVSPS